MNGPMTPLATGMQPADLIPSVPEIPYGKYSHELLYVYNFASLPENLFLNENNKGTEQPGHPSSDSFTILGFWVHGLTFSHINESNYKVMSPEHYF